MRGVRLLQAALILLLATPFSAAQSTAHENFARTEADPEALQALGGTLLNFTERAFVATLDGNVSAAERAARLTLALTEDLALIASLSEVESAGLIRPYIGPYSRLASNTTNVTDDFAALTVATPDEHLTLIYFARDDVLGMYADADAFDAIGHDAARLRELLGLLLDLIDIIQPSPPAEEVLLLLTTESPLVPLGRDLHARALLVSTTPRADIEVRFALDGAPWEVASTDERGGARVSQRIPLDARLGEHRLEATATLDGRPLFAEAVFDVVKIPTRLVFRSAEGTVPPERDTVLRARLMDDLRSGIPGSEGILVVDGGEPTNVTFLSDGSLALRIRAGDLPLGAHEATLAYAGDATHDAAFARARWEIGIPPDRPPSDGAPRGGEEDEPFLAFPEPIDLPKRAVEVVFASPPVILWPVLVAAILLVQLGVWRALSRPTALLAGVAAPIVPTVTGAPAAPILRLERRDEARSVVLSAYRDLLVSLERDGVATHALTHHEVARELLARGHDPRAVAEITRTFEEVRYARKRPAPGALARYLPLLMRLIKRRGAA